MLKYTKFESMAYRLLFGEGLGLPLVVQRLQNEGLSARLAKRIAIGILAKDYCPAISSNGGYLGKTRLGAIDSAVFSNGSPIADNDWPLSPILFGP